MFLVHMASTQYVGGLFLFAMKHLNITLCKILLEDNIGQFLGFVTDSLCTPTFQQAGQIQIE